MLGRIKWFDSRRGFGFVVPDEGGDDVMLGAKALDGAAMRALDGARIDFDVVEFEGRRRVSRIYNIERAYEHGVEKYTVGWFSRTRGYGFLRRDGEEDVMVHVNTLNQCGFDELKPGMRVMAKVAEGEGRRRCLEIYRLGVAAE